MQLYRRGNHARIRSRPVAVGYSLWRSLKTSRSEIWLSIIGLVVVQLRYSIGKSRVEVMRHHNKSLIRFTVRRSSACVSFANTQHLRSHASVQCAADVLSKGGKVWISVHWMQVLWTIWRTVCTLQRLKESRMGFFEDWSPPNPMATQVLTSRLLWPHRVNDFCITLQQRTTTTTTRTVWTPLKPRCLKEPQRGRAEATISWVVCGNFSSCEMMDGCLS